MSHVICNKLLICPITSLVRNSHNHCRNLITFTICNVINNTSKCLQSRAREGMKCNYWLLCEMCSFQWSMPHKLRCVPHTYLFERLQHQDAILKVICAYLSVESVRNLKMYFWREWIIGGRWKTSARWRIVRIIASKIMMWCYDFIFHASKQHLHCLNDMLRHQ